MHILFFYLIKSKTNKKTMPTKNLIRFSIDTTQATITYFKRYVKKSTFLDSVKKETILDIKEGELSSPLQKNIKILSS